MNLYKLLCFIMIGFFLSSGQVCAEFLGNDSTNNEQEFFVYLKPKINRVLRRNVTKLDDRSNFSESLTRYLRNNDLKIPIREDIYSDLVYGFKIKLNQEQSDRFSRVLRKNVVDIIPINFKIQGKPIMQGSKPIMQGEDFPEMEEFYFDHINKTSYGITHIGNSQNEGNKGRVWVVDSGIDSSHPDLRDNLMVNSELHKAFIGSDPLLDVIGHGTHCAGVIAAKTNQTELGMNGVSQGAPLVSIKVLDDDGEGEWINVLKALEYIGENISDNQVEVILMSLGAQCGEGDTNCRKILGPLSEAIKELTRTHKNLYIVMSAGNCESGSTTCDRDARKNIPGSISGKNIITIGAIDYDQNELGGISDFSYLNTKILFFFPRGPIRYVAPGGYVYSTFPTENGVPRYISWSGTSMAAAMVAGIISNTGKLPGQIGEVRHDGIRYWISGIEN